MRPCSCTLDSMSYQLSHATKYEVGVVSTTNVIITPLRGVVKVLGEFFGRHRQRRNAGRAVQRRYHAHIRRDAIIGVRRAGGATPPLQPLSRLRRQLPLEGEPRLVTGHYQLHSPLSTLHSHISPNGNRTLNVAPMPGALSTVTSPPQRSTMRLTSARPRPLPSVAWAVSP